MTSYNGNDVRQGYCGHCHDWTSPPYGVNWSRPPDETRRCERCGVDVPLVAWHPVHIGDHVVVVMEPLRYETGPVDADTNMVTVTVRGGVRLMLCSEMAHG